MVSDLLTPSTNGPIDTDIAARLAELTSFINEKLENLRSEFGVETLLLVTRGTLEQPQFSRAKASTKASRFLREVFRIDAGQLAEKLEGYVVSGAGDYVGTPSSSMNITKMKQKEQIKIARDFILNGLIDALREENVPEDQIPKSMNYKSYETKIVDQYGVLLIGFPGERGIVNPGELDAVTLKELLCCLNDGRCHWRSLNKSASGSRNTAYPGCTSGSSSCYDMGAQLPRASFSPQTPTPTPNASDAGQSPTGFQSTLPVVGIAQVNDGTIVTSEYEDRVMQDDAYYLIAQSLPPREPMNRQSDPSLSKAMDMLQRAYFNACLALLGNEHPNSNLSLPTPSTALDYFHSQFASICQSKHVALSNNDLTMPPQMSGSVSYLPESTLSCNEGQPSSQNCCTNLGLYMLGPELQPAISGHSSLHSAFPESCIDIGNPGIWPYVDGI